MKYFQVSVFITFLLISSCQKERKDPVPAIPIAPETVRYYADGRTVKASDVNPIALDIEADGTVDYTVFVQLTANSEGDHLYAGINPIGTNLIKSGPSNEEQFLNMGFLVTETKYALLDSNLSPNQQWTYDHSTLVIRHTKMDNSVWFVWYEGGWNDESEQIVAIQHSAEGKYYMGWLRLKFNRTDETITLIDYAYNIIENSYIIAGYH